MNPTTPTTCKPDEKLSCHLHSNQSQLTLQGLLPNAALDLDKGFVAQSRDVNVRFGWMFVSGQLFGHVVPFHFWKATGDLAHVAIFLRFFSLACTMLTLVYFVSRKGLLLHASLYLQDSVDLV